MTKQLVIDAVGATVARILNAALVTVVVVLVARSMGVDL